jgi:hypothetical protein
MALVGYESIRTVFTRLKYSSTSLVSSIAFCASLQRPACTVPLQRTHANINKRPIATALPSQLTAFRHLFHQLPWILFLQQTDYFTEPVRSDASFINCNGYSQFLWATGYFTEPVNCIQTIVLPGKPVSTEISETWTQDLQSAKQQYYRLYQDVRYVQICSSLVYTNLQIYSYTRIIITAALWSSAQSSWLQIHRSGVDFRRYQIFWEVVGLERGPLSLVSTAEELLGGKSSGFGL